ncbi:MAG: hypothetical protein U0796_05705 [Gemmatales bacterium]
MAQPMPPPPPPKQGLGLFGYLFMLAFVVLVVGYFQGWFDFNKNPETGKRELNIHTDKFKKDKDAMVKATSETYASIKEKFTKKEADSKTAKPEEKANLDKEIADLKAKLEKAEALKKKAEESTNDEGLKGLEEQVKKLLPK